MCRIEAREELLAALGRERGRHLRRPSVNRLQNSAHLLSILQTCKKHKCQRGRISWHRQIGNLDLTFDRHLAEANTELHPTCLLRYGTGQHHSERG